MTLRPCGGDFAFEIDDPGRKISRAGGEGLLGTFDITGFPGGAAEKKKPGEIEAEKKDEDGSEADSDTAGNSHSFAVDFFEEALFFWGGDDGLALIFIAWKSNGFILDIAAVFGPTSQLVERGLFAVD